MNKQAGQIVLYLMLSICLTAGMWAYMRWSNHIATQSLTANIDRLDQSLDRKEFRLTQAQTDRQAMVEQLAQLSHQRRQEAADFLLKENTLKQELGDWQARFSQQEDSAAKLQQAVLAKDTVIDNLQKQISEKSLGIDTLTNEKQSLVADIAVMTEALSTGKSTVAALALERDNIAGQVQVLEDELAQLNQYSEQLNTQYTRVQGELASEIERAKNYSAQLETLEERYAREQAALVALEKEIEEYRAQNQSLEQTNALLLTNKEQLDVEKRQLIEQYENGIAVIRLPNRILFDTGSAQLNRQGRETLALVARSLKAFPQHLISVEGHTDHRPIGNTLVKRYPSNWELSSARAASAIRVLVDESVPAQQFQVVGFADTRPLVAKANTEQLGQNRRIEILLLPPLERKQQELN